MANALGRREWNDLCDEKIGSVWDIVLELAHRHYVGLDDGDSDNAEEERRGDILHCLYDKYIAWVPSEAALDAYDRELVAATADKPVHAHVERFEVEEGESGSEIIPGWGAVVELLFDMPLRID